MYPPSSHEQHTQKSAQESPLSLTTGPMVNAHFFDIASCLLHAGQHFLSYELCDQFLCFSLETMNLSMARHRLRNTQGASRLKLWRACQANWLQRPSGPLGCVQCVTETSMANNPAQAISLQKPAPKAAHLVPKQRPPVPDLQRANTTSHCTTSQGHSMPATVTLLICQRSILVTALSLSDEMCSVPDDPVMLKLTREIRRHQMNGWYPLKSYVVYPEWSDNSSCSPDIKKKAKRHELGPVPGGFQNGIYLMQGGQWVIGVLHEAVANGRQGIEQEWMRATWVPLTLERWGLGSETRPG
ncbi:hypothetical protein B0H10DRAFT_1970377 [Mycena sp. CBHHK59/15]|nr:hypothetical protein B0H10DRAFT_1970377 [Mycena sp. CBHHK59/15]